MISDSDLEKLSRMLQQASDKGFTGTINISFFKGGIANIVKQESFKLADIT